MSKASTARRDRRLARKGRPPGTTGSLFRDRQRFAIAAWIAFSSDYGPHVTARFVTVLIEEVTPIRIEDVEGLRLIISASFKAPASADLDDYALALARKAKLIRERAADRELRWLSTSASALRGLIYFFQRSDVPGMRRSLDILRQAGWEKVSWRIGQRLEAALKSNIPPYDGPLAPAARRFLDVLRAERAENLRLGNDL